MPNRTVHVCQCKECQGEDDNPSKELHRRINLFLSTLNHQQRRWYAAMEADRVGYGGVKKISMITGVSDAVISRGRHELVEAAMGRQISKVPRVYRGPKTAEEKYPDIDQVLESLLAYEVAGDPMGEQRWVRSSLRNLSRQLRDKGYDVSHNLVRRLLRKLGYTLRVNIKARKGNQSPHRDEQFKYIAAQRRAFAASNLPIISVDTKKKESIGNFKQNGKGWCKEPEEVNEYDFTSMAICRAVPYGVYDVTKNRGYVYVGTSGDTPEFAADAITRWWRDEGQTAYPDAEELLILADGGGCNGWRSRAWKCNIQEKLSDAFGLRITLCHYPTRCSKWNPVEFRLFSHISMNWAGKPLRSLDIMMAYIRGTTTTTGLRVEACLLEGEYLTSRKVSTKELEQLELKPHAVCPDWNYTISPRNPRTYEST